MSCFSQNPVLPTDRIRHIQIVRTSQNRLNLNFDIGLCKTLLLVSIRPGRYVMGVGCIVYVAPRIPTSTSSGQGRRSVFDFFFFFFFEGGDLNFVKICQNIVNC